MSRLTSRRALMDGAQRRRPALRRWAIRLVALVVLLVVLWKLLLVAVGIATSDMWFDSVDAGSVYTTMIEARVVLFVVFGVIAALIGGLTLFVLRRIKDRLEVSADTDTFRWTLRKYESKVGKLLVLLAAVIPGVVVGSRAAGAWQTYLLWRHATPFHRTDPLFHKDISFFLEIYPFHLMVVSLLSQALTYGLWIAVVGGYWFAAWRLRGGRRKITKSFTILMSLLLAGFLVCKALNYWLARYALTTSGRGPVTGSSATDVHAGLPSKYVLFSVALLCAVALFANALRGGRLRVVIGALALAVVSSLVVGTAWPSLYYRFEESPSAARVDLGEIARNQAATRAAFGLDGDVTTLGYNPSTTLDDEALDQLAGTTSQTSLLDPNQISPTFNVLAQLQSYYGFKSTLDVSHYDLGGVSRDVDLAVRELQLGSIPSSSWVNSHLVYTHGYGVVAAPTTEVDPGTSNPVFLNGGIPPQQQIPVTRPDVYFGQFFTPSSYAIVGQPKGSATKLEFDHPGANGSSRSAFTTYAGHGGIPIGSTLRRALFALQMRSASILFSSEINSASQLLTVRNPRARVAKVAPWLTLDGNVYPAIVDGQIKWIVDGYTTSSTYPDSQSINLRSASATTLTVHGASVGQSNTNINYMQNSVKAVVDAYTGKVTLYAWNQKAHPDPLLDAWESVFPGLVKSQSSIPSALLDQLRYPSDLFNVQRTLLAQYHVSSPSDFYSGNDFWKVPSDPTVTRGNAGNSGRPSPQPSRYASMSSDGYGGQQYSLSSPMVTLNGRDLASFVYVNSQPGPDYGKFTVLDFPSDAAAESPAQVQNDIESDTTITEALTLERGGNSRVVLGDLEAIPLAGRMLYVEPVYTRSSGNLSFPILRHVIALYGNGQPSFDDTLSQALKDAIASADVTTGTK